MKNKTKIQLGLVCGLLMSNLAQADLLFTVGGNASLWRATPEGQMDNNLKLGSDGLNLEATNGTQLSLFFKHPVPFIPNLRVRQTNIATTGDSKLSASFMNQSFSEDVTTSLDLSHTDLTLIWGLPIPLPLIDFGFGINARNFNGGAKIEGKTTKQMKEVDIKATLPMLYAGLKVNTPVGIYAKGEVNYIGFKENAITDYEAALGYDLPVPVVDLGVELGYRALQMKTDKDTVKIDTDVKVNGAYFGISAAFGF